MRQNSRIGSGIIALVLLLSWYIVAPGSMIVAQAAIFKGEAKEAEVSITLDTENPEENIPFQMTNMLPGDSITRYYRLDISSQDTVTVDFQIDIGEGDVKLADVLEAKVRLMNTDEVLYEGVVTDLSAEKVLNVSEGQNTQELCYEVELGLATNVGNEYQNLHMRNVVLSWQMEVEEQSESDEDDPTEDSGFSGGNDSIEDSEFSDEVEGGSVVETPGTGDNTPIMWYLMSIIVVLVVLVSVWQRYHMLQKCSVESGQAQLKKDKKRLARLKRGMFFMVFLMLGLGITTFALTYKKVILEDNFISTAIVDIDMKEEVPIFDGEILLEPGMMIKRNVTVCNKGTCSAYYRLYFQDVTGELAKDLKSVVMDGEKVLYEGALEGLMGEKTEGATGLLLESEERTLSIEIYLPEECNNTAQNNTVIFDVRVDAVQVANNPDGLFE